MTSSSGNMCTRRNWIASAGDLVVSLSHARLNRQVRQLMVESIGHPRPYLIDCLLSGRLALPPVRLPQDRGRAPPTVDQVVRNGRRSVSVQLPMESESTLPATGRPEEQLPVYLHPGDNVRLREGIHLVSPVDPGLLVGSSGQMFLSNQCQQIFD